MSVRQRLFLLGGVLLLLGLLAGFFPSVASDGVECGSPLVDQTGSAGSDIKAGCADARRPLQLTSIGLLAGGALIVAGGWVAGGRTRAEASAAR
jgi:hypothetical protein